MIRHATREDIPLILDMGERFFRKAWGDGFDRKATMDFVGGMIDGAGVVFLSPKGMIGGILCPVYCAPTKVQAVELWWWARDGYGRDLLREFEKWAWDSGADEVRMSCIQHVKGEAVAKALTKAGYEPCEVSFRKGIG